MRSIFLAFLLLGVFLSHAAGQKMYGNELMEELYTLMKEGKKGEAVQKINSIIQEKYAQKDWDQLAWAITCKSNIYMSVNGFQQDSVLRVYNEGIQLASKEDSPKFYLDMLMARTEVYQRLHQWEKTLTDWREALTLTSPDSKERSQVLQRLCESMHWLNMDRDTINALSNESLRIAYLLSDSMRIASVLEGTATRSKYHGNYQSSIDQLIDALKYVKKERRYSLKRIAILNRIANLFFETEDFDKGIEYGHQALELASTMGYKNSIAEANEILGSLYLSKNAYLKAKDFYTASYNHFKTKPNYNYQTSALLGLVDVSLKMDQLDSVSFYLEKLRMSSPNSTKFMQSHAAMMEGRYQFRLGNIQKSKIHFLEADQIARQSNFPKQHMRVLEDLQKVYRSEGNYEFALEALDQVLSYRDSLYDSRTQQIIQDNEARFNKAEQEKSIAKLESDNTIKDLEIKAGKRQMIAGGFGLIIFILLSAWVWKLYLQKKQTNRLLEEKNQTIHTSLKEKEALLKEIHHRVKNNLQMISSLLNLQSRTMDDQVAIAALQEGKNRVRSMALIHQNLYQDENLIGIDIQSYMEKLSESLFQTYAVEPDKIQFSSDIDAVKLDVEQVIPLGLIINELISNALKYAFENRSSGKIKLTIKKKEEELFVEVKDDGIGLPDDFSVENHESLGFKLIRIFSNKLKADLNIEDREGTSVSMRIPLSA